MTGNCVPEISENLFLAPPDCVEKALQLAGPLHINVPLPVRRKKVFSLKSSIILR